MNFKLRKTCKLNMIIAVIMCVSLLFCFCSTSYVQAAESVSNYDDYLTFQDSFTKAGYLSSYDHSNEGWEVAPTSKVDELSVKDLSSIKITYSGNYSYVLSTYWDKWLSDSGLSVSGLDVYCVAIGDHNTYQDGVKTYRSLHVYYLFVPSGTKVCMGLDSSNDYSVITQRGLRFCSSSPYMFFMENIVNYRGSESQYSKQVFAKCDGYDGKSESGIYGSYGLFYKENDYYFCSIDMGGTDKAKPFCFTNMPTIGGCNNGMFDNATLKKFMSGDDTVATNVDPSYTDKKEYPAESFYWDDMTCKPSSVGNSKYAFSFNYTYSCPLMIDPAEMFSCDVVYNSDIRYQDGKGRVHTYTDSKTDTFSLNKHKNGYVNNSLYLNSTLLDNTGSSAQHKLDELFDGIVGLFGHVDLDTRSDTEITVKSAKIYVTVFLYHVPDPDTLFSNPDIMQSAKENMIMSTDVRSFSFDLFNLKADAYGAVVKPTVTTEDVKDNDGNVVDKKVTDVAANDDSGKTVINITIDNSNKVVDGNANINTGGGSGGDSDDDDKNTKSFWKYVTGIVAFFTALLNSDSGLFAVIASYFKFIPSDFWNVTIGAIVVIAVLSIYRLAKKGG